MENFTARDDRGWKVIQRAIDTTDYYVLIIAGRYGSIDSAIGMSWTEREYEYAFGKKIPILAFIREQSWITVDRTDRDPDPSKKAEKSEKLATFKEKLTNRHMFKAWSDINDLRAKVAAALNARIREDEDDGTPRPGWYRGDQLPQTVASEELAELFAENRRLHAQLAAAAGPSIEVQLADHKSRQLFGLSHTIVSTVAGEYKNPRLVSAEMAILTASRDPYEPRPETIWEFRREMALIRPVWFHFKNTGRVTSTGTRLELIIPKKRDLVLYDDASKPERPRSQFDIGIGRAVALVTPLEANDFADHWKVNIDAGKLQPEGEKWVSSPLYLGSRSSQEVEARGRIFADNLPKPIDVLFHFKFDAVRGSLPPEKNNE
jgi:hypothetical protein